MKINDLGINRNLDIANHINNYQLVKSTTTSYAGAYFHSYNENIAVNNETSQFVSTHDNFDPRGKEIGYIIRYK